ncbi:MAG: glycine cleavage system aminomethyltransferase GcvT [Candidatus Margulisiibacteriota bacterium]
MLKRTPLYDTHLALNAKIVPFAGWEMPVSYPAGIIAEHTAVRTAAGIFDIGHMGLIKIEGIDALPFLQSVATNDVSKLEVNQCQYAILCNEKGGTVDDILVYRLPMNYLIVCNACNYDKVLAWLTKHAQSFKSLVVAPYENYCMLSIQGPKALEITSKVLSAPLNALKHNHVLWWRDILVSRTGYTGEDGAELIVAKSETKNIWELFINAGVQPCGLGARDTLRLEAGLPLYGHEYDDDTSPLEAGYSWAVKFDKGNFIGRAALLEAKEKGLRKKLVGLEIEGRAIAREGNSIVDSRTSIVVGKITSGTFSPTLKKPIAMAYLEGTGLGLGAGVGIEIRGNIVPAKIVAKTLYKR